MFNTRVIHHDESLVHPFMLPNQHASCPDTGAKWCLHPNLISAKCTHLGCTVGSEADDKGRILCPCHISFFDIKSGQPNAGAPAKEPLAKLGWVLRDDKGEVVARMGPHGRLQGNVDRTKLDRYGVFAAREFEEERL